MFAPLLEQLAGELEGKVLINISNPRDSQSHQVLSTAGPKVLENISEVRGVIRVRVQSLLPWRRVILGFRGALSSLAGRQSLREHLACSFLPVKVEPPASAFISATILHLLGPSSPGPGALSPSPSSMLRSLRPTHSSPPCCAHLGEAGSSEGPLAAHPAPSFAFNGSALCLILFSSGFSV